MEEKIFIQDLAETNRKRLRRFPDKKKAELFVEELFQFLFVQTSHHDNTEENLQEIYGGLKNSLTQLINDSEHDITIAADQTKLFFATLPRLYSELMKDAEAVLAFDPAAQSLDEVVVSYPGFFATAVYRLSHQLWQQNIALLPRILAEYAHSKTGIDIHPGAQIGASFSIDHGTGVVIGETSIIGEDVKVYQGVTLGALSVAKEEASRKRHPTIEDGVVIYSGATILGGNTVVGRGSIVGGNVWLTSSIPPDSVVYHTSEIKIKDRNPFPEPINFII